MLYFFRTTVPLSTSKEALTAQLKQHRAFDVQEKQSKLFLARRRMLPNRGLTRLLIPRIVTRLTLSDTAVKFAFGLDAIATIMLFFIGGGVLVELTADRSEYPRDYPPEFIYGIALIYLVAVVYDLLKTRALIKKLVV